jgi:hypothetical protein
VNQNGDGNRGETEQEEGRQEGHGMADG